MHWRLKLWNDLGARAETRALKFLKGKGLKLVARNYACGTGELDLIMLQGHVLVFIEVRSRSSSLFGAPVETVTPSKQSKIRRTSAHFLRNHPEHSHRECRFDVVTLIHNRHRTSQNNDDNLSNPIEWFRGAFY